MESSLAGLRRSQSLWPRDSHCPQETLRRLEKATKDIDAIKKQVRASAVEAANNALDRLERDDPAQYDKLLRERRSNK